MYLQLPYSSDYILLVHLSTVQARSLIKTEFKLTDLFFMTTFKQFAEKYS